MIRLLIIAILFIVVLSLLGINVASLVNNKTLRENFSYVWGWVSHLWNAYLKEPFLKAVLFIWNEILKPSLDQLRSLNKNNARTMLMRSTG